MRFILSKKLAKALGCFFLAHFCLGNALGAPRGNSAPRPVNQEPANTPETRTWSSSQKPGYGDQNWALTPHLGISANLPELVDVLGGVRFGKWLDMQVAWGIPAPIHVRVEMPSDIIKATDTVAIANPATDLDFHLRYGPHLGLRTEVRPWENWFFVGLSATRRTITIQGQGQSPVLICSLQEAVKEPPCGRVDDRIETTTQIRIQASARMESTVFGLYLGGHWDFNQGTYVKLYAGLAIPQHSHTSVDVDSSLVSETPDFETDKMSDALRRLKANKDAEMEEKAKSELDRVDRARLPILGITLGWNWD